MDSKTIFTRTSKGEDEIRSKTAHLSGDITRAYGLLVREWLAHMEHLKREYPYLFSLAVRMNPFDPEASAVVA